MSVTKTSSPASFCPACTIPNSAACLIELIVTVPALAKPMTWEPDPCAWSRKEEKSDVLIGTRTAPRRSEEHTSALQSLMRRTYAVFCLKKKQHTDTGNATNGKATFYHTITNDHLV